MLGTMAVLAPLVVGVGVGVPAGLVPVLEQRLSTNQYVHYSWAGPAGDHRHVGGGSCITNVCALVPSAEQRL